MLQWKYMNRKYYIVQWLHDVTLELHTHGVQHDAVLGVHSVLSLVPDTPRSAGRQCMRRACGPAARIRSSFTCGEHGTVQRRLGPPYRCSLVGKRTQRHVCSLPNPRHQPTWNPWNCFLRSAASSFCPMLAHTSAAPCKHMPAPRVSGSTKSTWHPGWIYDIIISSSSSRTLKRQTDRCRRRRRPSPPPWGRGCTQVRIQQREQEGKGSRELAHSTRGDQACEHTAARQPNGDCANSSCPSQRHGGRIRLKPCTAQVQA